MKATGIVRRIDDLGRVVIPKEIRRTLRIREGDPLEIFTDREGEIILKKYSPIGELGGFARQYADVLAQNPEKLEDKLQRLKTAFEAYNIIIEEKAPLSKKDLAVSGRDLIEAGVSPGPGLGKMLDRLLEYVLDDPEKNNREQLIRYINMNKNEEGD